MSRISIQLDENLITPRKHGQLMKRLLREQIEFHRDQILPKHFEAGAVARYGYKPRARGYMIKKARLKGHQRPDVYTGKMRENALNKDGSRITATQNRSRLVIRGNHFPMTTDRRRELEEITLSEQSDIAKRLQARYVQLVVTPEYQRKRRRKGA